MKMANITGLIIISIGGVLLLGYALFEIFKELFFDSTMPIVIKIGIITLIIGIIILLSSLIIERVKEKGN